MTTFSSEQLNFFKFSTVVFDEFPVALRKVFVYMWDTQVAPIRGFQKWDDSLRVRNMFLHKEGGKTKYVPTNKSFKEWDCTALFEATVFAQSFAMPDGKGGSGTLNKLYVKPRHLPSGTFHPSVISPSGNQAETFALALDQLRLLRNTVCHQISTQEIDKAAFDNYIQLAKDAFAALGQSVTKIDDIGKLGEKDFPSTRVQELEAELRSEKFKQIEDNLDQIESQLNDVGSDVKDVKYGVTDVKTKVDEVQSQVKIAVTDVKTKVDELRSDVKTAARGVKTKVDEAGSDVKIKVEEIGSEVKTAVTDVKTKVDEVGSDVKSAVTDVKEKVDEVASEVKSAATDVTAKVDEVASHVKSAVTDVTAKVDEVASEVKTAATDVKKKVYEVGSEVKTAIKNVMTTVKADIDDMKQAMEAGISNGPFVPDSCIPDNIPHFVGREEECQAILEHLTDATTRLVNVWGPPGFGKTSVAINVAHYLQDMKIPVYFAPLRGMESKEELVSKLLSIFADASHMSHISSSHWLIQCLQQQKNPFVLILDNADDLLEYKDVKRKEQVFRFIDEILAQCKHIKLLLTTRESLDFLSHKLPIHLEKINVLNEPSSARLVKLLLPDVSEDDCSCVIRECGQVPLSIRLMCSIMGEENISITELLEELKYSPLVEVLDSESLPDDTRLKTLIDTSFQRLSDCERNAFACLAVFPGWFGIEDATAVLDVKTDLTTKKIIRSLERKSMIDCGDNFSHFTIHSLLRSFIEEVRRKDKKTETIFFSAQFRFYDYYIDSFKVANEKFLVGPSNEASATFFDRRENILLSLTYGTRDDKLYPKVVDVLSMAELFLYAVLFDEELLFEQLYDTAVEEAKRRKNVADEWQLLAAKSFRHLGWFSSGSQTWDHSLYAVCTSEADCSAKPSCYYGIYQLLCGNRDDGVSSLLGSVDRLSSRSDEVVLRYIIYWVLGVLFTGNDNEMASHYECLLTNWFKARFPFLFEEHQKCDAELFFLVTLVRFQLQFEIFQSLLRADPTWDDFGMKLTVRCLTNPLLGRANVKPETIVTNLVLKDPMFTQLLLKDWGCSTDSPEFPFIEPLLRYWVELVDHFLKSGLDSIQSYDAAKQLMESILYFFESSGLSPSVDNKSLRCDLTALFDPKIEEVLKSNEQVPGRDMVDVARSYDTLGMAKSFLNDHNSAVESHQQAIRVREENIGDHLDTVSSLINIGCLYFAMKNPIEADKAFQNALELRKRLGICDDVDTANFYFTVGEKHNALGNYEKALEAHLQALKLRMNFLREHSLTAKSLSEVGRVYLAMGSHPEALEFCHQALAMRLALLQEHVDTATSFNLLGCIHFKMGENMSAVQAFEAAVDMRSKLLGDHGDTACSYHLLGEVQGEMGNWSGAVESLQKAWQIRKEVFGEGHLQTTRTLHLLNEIYEVFALALES